MATSAAVTMAGVRGRAIAARMPCRPRRITAIVTRPKATKSGPNRPQKPGESKAARTEADRGRHYTPTYTDGPA